MSRWAPRWASLTPWSMSQPQCGVGGWGTPFGTTLGACTGTWALITAVRAHRKVTMCRQHMQHWVLVSNNGFNQFYIKKCLLKSAIRLAPSCSYLESFIVGLFPNLETFQLNKYWKLIKLNSFTASQSSPTKSLLNIRKRFPN